MHTFEGAYAAWRDLIDFLKIKASAECGIQEGEVGHKDLPRAYQNCAASFVPFLGTPVIAKRLDAVLSSVYACPGDIEIYDECCASTCLPTLNKKVLETRFPQETISAIHNIMAIALIDPRLRRHIANGTLTYKGFLSPTFEEMQANKYMIALEKVRTSHYGTKEMEDCSGCSFVEAMPLSAIGGGSTSCQVELLLSRSDGERNFMEIWERAKEMLRFHQACIGLQERGEDEPTQAQIESKKESIVLITSRKCPYKPTAVNICDLLDMDQKDIALGNFPKK